MQTYAAEQLQWMRRVALLRRAGAILILLALFVGFAAFDRPTMPAAAPEAPAPKAIAVEDPHPDLLLESVELARGKRAFERGDYRAAHDDLLIAAGDGEPLAQELIGFMYALGTIAYPGISQNLVAAGQWLDLAARNGRPAARHFHCAMVRQAFPERRLSELNCFDEADIEDRH